jgi:hypothetical protein
MASKICPSCGAKNPSDAYSCQNCAASFVDFPPEGSVPSDISSISGRTYRKETAPPTDSFEKAPVTVTSARYQTPSIQTDGQPVAVVRQSAMRNMLNALTTLVFLLLFGIGAGFATGSELLSILIIAAVVGVPFAFGYIFRPSYEFYDTHFTKVSRSSRQETSYSDIQSVDPSRSGIRIVLKNKSNEVSPFRQRGVIVPGNPKLPDGSDLAAWLKGKVSPQKETDSSEPQNHEVNS